VSQKQKKLQKTIQTNKLSASEAKSMVERHTSDAERYGGEAVELTENLKVAEAELEKIRDALKEKTQGFSDEIAKKQKTLEPWVEKVNQKRSAIAVAQSELDILHAKSNESRVALEEAQAKIRQIEEARTTKQEELKECQKEEASLKKGAQKVQTELEKMNQREPQLRNNVSNARQKADEAKFSLAASQTQGTVLTNLTRLRETGRIEGFHGRLGGLGAIDVKYDVAISTACPQLENMIVDSVPVAQQCIDHLRKNNLGRATFLCLDKLQQAPAGRIKTPENAPRLFDLIKPTNPDYLPAFWKVLGNTLVADSLEQADRIAYGAERWRVVTLNGELIEKAGTMTGGGSSVSKGRMSSKIAQQVSKDTLQKLEQERDGKEESYAEFQEQQRGLESDLRDIKERIPELEITISKIRLEIEASVRGIADAERRIQELSKEKGTSTQDKNRIAALTKQIKGLEKEIEQLQAETEDIKEEIQALQDKIMEVGGMKLRSQKAQVDGIREQVETLNEQISGADLARTKAEKQIAKAEKVIASSEKELTDNETELEELRENMKESERNSHESKKKAEEAQDVGLLSVLPMCNVLTWYVVPRKKEGCACIPQGGPRRKAGRIE
jgi:structural maintenance of chromosome 4